ncbi:unnamed protein product [Adineta steineri]|uniref:t-SNARE coiled-coil homology domain-containing protein n=1 Tax=Adineta steineri TaxID=433720 RepID=A0A819I3X1_9BILA|nr:unnamed protein product [Adineta steineri]
MSDSTNEMTNANDIQRLYNAISTNLTQINNHVKDLEKLVQKLGTSEDSEPLRDNSHRLQNETTVLIQHTNDALQQLKNMRVLTNVDQRRLKTLTESLPKQYITTLERFREVQNIALRKEKESFNRSNAIPFHQQGISNPLFANDFISTPISYQHQQQTEMKALTQRAEQIGDLETLMVEVSELIKDMAQLVSEHGVIIETIEDHVREAEKQTHQASDHVGRAREYQVLYFSIFIASKC